MKASIIKNGSFWECYETSSRKELSAIELNYESSKKLISIERI